MKYIDADRLRAEIESYRKECEDSYGNPGDNDFPFGKVMACQEIIGIINSLQQEQPEMSIKKNCNDCPHCVDRKDQYGWHFKGCFGGQYKGKFIAEIDECPLQQEQPDDLASLISEATNVAKRIVDRDSFYNSLPQNLRDKYTSKAWCEILEALSTMKGKDWPPCHYGGECTNPFHDCINCHRQSTVGINTTTGTSTSKLEG